MLDSDEDPRYNNCEERDPEQKGVEIVRREI